MSCGKRHPSGWIVLASEEIWLLFDTGLAMFEVLDNQFLCLNFEVYASPLWPLEFVEYAVTTRTFWRW
jgi:hypothetical protein